MDRNRLGEMEVFVAVVEAGSFSAAGRRMRLTPSAVAKLVARLEERLGVRLVTRSTRAVRPTAEGEAFFHRSRQLLADVEDAERSVTGAVAPRGRLRVNASVAFALHMVIPLVPDFTARYPGVLVDLTLSDGMVDLLEERADVAIRLGPMPDSSLTARHLGHSTRAIVASPDYLRRRGLPRHPDDLAAHDCIGFNFRRAMVDWPFRLPDGRLVERPISGSVEVNSGEAARQAVLAGAGLGRLGTYHIAGDVAAGRLVPVLEDHNPGDGEDVHAVFAGGPLLSPRVRAFVDFLAERLGPARRWTLTG